ncbi:MAG: proton-conducting transporter membrane subunit [Gemmatales bacterium]
MIALLCAIVPFTVAIVLIAARQQARQLAKPALVITAGLNLLSALLAGITRGPGVSITFLGNYLVLDATSALFLVLVAIVFFGITIHVSQRFTFGPAEPGMDGFVIRSILFLGLSNLAVICNHLVGMWVLLEAATLIIAPLIFFNRGPVALRASWKYLKFSVIGLGFNMVGLMCLARAMGGIHGDHEITFFLDELQKRTSLGETVWWEIGLAFMVLGLGTKLGLAPMYAWLPDAYDEAPPAVTTLLAAVQFNCVLLFLFRQVGLLRSFDPTLVSMELITMGVLSIAISGLHIVRAENYKRLIAYASINHAGTIALGLGMGRNAAYGVVLYVVSNALVKAVLFLTCGNIKDHYRTKQMASLRGLIRVMPFSGLAFTLGTFALLGFAPFGSFLGEIIILSNMAEGGFLLLFLFLCVMLTINLVATGRALFPMIWGDTEEEEIHVKEPIWSIASSAFYILVLVSLGIYTPEPVTALLREVAMTLDGK